MLESALAQTVLVRRVCVIDNGQNEEALKQSLGLVKAARVATDVFTPRRVMGVAEAWNWFIDYIPEERLIVADDVEFPQQDVFQRMMDTPGDFVTARWFGCFIIRNSCIDKVGRFDELISPGYLYYEDIDYAQRMKNASVPITEVAGGVLHVGSASLLAIPEAERQIRHHDRFLIAQQNYIRKWGSIPDWIPQVP